MEDIQSLIFDYICKANRKIAELSSEANDLLNKTGCNCDISHYVEDINDINSSLYILNKGWDNIEPTFGYKNFLVSLFPEDEFDVSAATIEIIHAYIDRYSMLDSSNIIFPLSQVLYLGASCCGDFVTGLYFNKTESDERYYPLNSNPEGYLKESDLDGLATEDYVNSQGFLTTEEDPTVPSWVKNILQSDIDYWNSKLDNETDPTVPSWVKLITEADILSWNNKLSSETDPTVPEYVKDITTLNISNWNQAYQTTLNLTPLFIPASTFTGLTFSRLGGYIVGTEAQPLSSGSINLSIGGNIAFSRAVIYHQSSSKPTFNGVGITVTSIGEYTPSSVNEIILFYNGSGRVVALFTGESSSDSSGLLVKGTITVTSDTTVNLSGYSWQIDGSIYSSGSLNAIPVSPRPSSGIRVDSFWGDSSGNVLYIQGSDNLNEINDRFPDRVLLALFVRKSDEYEHPSYIPIDVNTSTGFVISRVSSDSIGSLIGVESRELSKVDVGLGNVDNTSDQDKPVSIAVQDAIDSLDSRFIRKDISDSNGVNLLTVGNLSVDLLVIFSSLPEILSPDFSLGITNSGAVVKTPAVVAQDIIDLQSQIDDLQSQINNIEGDKTYTHTQALDSDTWVVDHNLNKRPSISVYDSGNNSVRYEVDFVSLNSVILRFSSEMSGTADFN